MHGKMRAISLDLNQPLKFLKEEPFFFSQLSFMVLVNPRKSFFRYVTLIYIYICLRSIKPSLHQQHRKSIKTFNWYITIGIFKFNSEERVLFQNNTGVRTYIVNLKP